MPTRRLGVLSILAALAALAGCDDARPLAGAGSGGMGCSTCHGGLHDDTGAPPYDLAGNVTGGAVGAHREHLAAGVSCDSCHVVPADLEHAVGPSPADVVFGGLAIAEGTPEPYDSVGRRCSGVYCHGATLAGGLDPEPRWNEPLAGAPCGSCHGFPPIGVGPHVGGMTGCSGCHEGRHLDGALDVATGCTSCHGGVDNQTGAPPAVAIGNTVGGDVVGAHTVHVNAGIACSACHGATAPGAPGHADGGRAEIEFTGTAVADGAIPSYAAATFTCAGVYCHGGTLAGGIQPSPAWTGAVAGCTPCHGLPPVPPHAASDTACTSCHPAPSAPTHVNGEVDVRSPHADGFADRTVHGPAFLDSAAGASGALDCRSCHGQALAFCDACHASAASGSWASWETNCTFCHGTRTPAYTAASVTLASPPDTIAQRLTGSSASQATRIGKHREHLVFDASEPLYPAFPCATCHPVPETVAHVSVARRAQVAIDLGAAFPSLSAEEVAALPNGASYDPASGRCAVYCHGSAAWGASTTTNPTPSPLWSTAGGVIGIASCNACHGAPPPTGQPMPADDYCNPAPPATDCSMHEWHGNMLGALGLNGCSACHDGSVHLNGVPDVIFAARPLPGGGTVSGSWNRATASCTVNCHTVVIDPGLAPPGNPQSWR